MSDEKITARTSLPINPDAAGCMETVGETLADYIGLSTDLDTRIRAHRLEQA